MANGISETTEEKAETLLHLLLTGNLTAHLIKSSLDRAQNEGHENIWDVFLEMVKKRFESQTE